MKTFTLPAILSFLAADLLMCLFVFHSGDPMHVGLIAGVILGGTYFAGKHEGFKEGQAKR
jgi:hypothetical protein